MKHREVGAVEALCREIGFEFDKRMEQPAVLLAFVGVLIDEIADMRALEVMISDIPGVARKSPSEASSTAIQVAKDMLLSATPIESAAALHDYCHEWNPEGAYPSDRLIDLVSGCASAVRFGLEIPCHSRHAADAASWVWKTKYGIRCEDKHTSGWAKDWSRHVMTQALASFLPAPPPQPPHDRA